MDRPRRVTPRKTDASEVIGLLPEEEPLYEMHFWHLYNQKRRSTRNLHLSRHLKDLVVSEVAKEGESGR